jgi:hypothetical protein
LAARSLEAEGPFILFRLLASVLRLAWKQVSAKVASCNDNQISVGSFAPAVPVDGLDQLLRAYFACF